MEHPIKKGVSRGIMPKKSENVWRNPSREGVAFGEIRRHQSPLKKNRKTGLGGNLEMGRNRWGLNPKPGTRSPGLECIR